MDIFKLLSRSSGLQHKKPAAPAAAVHAKEAASQSGPVASKKRKTGASTTTALSALTIAEPHPELDFFGAAAGSDKLSSTTSKAGNSKKRKRNADGTSAESDEEAGVISSDEDDDEAQNEEESLLDIAPPPLPTTEETYKLAKEHKLKLTLMNPPPPPPEAAPAEQDDKQRKKHKKSKPAPPPEPEPAKKSKLVDTPPPTLLTSFTQLRAAPYTLSKRLYRNLIRQGYDTPTPVQMASIPLLLLGHEYSPPAAASADPRARIRTEEPINLLTCAQTGSGKTMAYMIPLMDWVLWKRGQLGKDGKDKGGTKALVVAPTKELVGQIYNEGLKLAIGTGVRIMLLNKSVVGKVKSPEEAAEGEDGQSGEEEDEEGGVKLPAEESKQHYKVKSDIIITTPTMLVHAIQNNTINLATIERLILDEADVLLESNDKGGGFGEDTLSAWKSLNSTSTSIRVSMWSATISSSIEAIATSMITPNTDSTTTTTTTSTPPASPLLRLLTGLKNTSLPHIKHTLTYTSTEPGKLLSLRNLLTTSFPPPALIFLQTVPRASALFREIQYDLPPGRIALLHAQLPDHERSRIMDTFRKGDIWALVTTDLLSRGVDWRGVRLVVNYDVPGSAAGYIHRAGRTGRGGREGGEVITFWTAGDARVMRPIAEVAAQAEREKERLDAKAAGGGAKPAAGGPKEGSAGWLLGFLPKVAKEDKKKLKKYGVEARNARRAVVPAGADGEGTAKVKVKGREKANREGTHGISTVSGWEKQKADRIRMAREASKRRKREAEGEGDGDGDGDGEGDDGEEFTGFD